MNCTIPVRRHWLRYRFWRKPAIPQKNVVKTLCQTEQSRAEQGGRAGQGRAGQGREGTGACETATSDGAWWWGCRHRRILKEAPVLRVAAPPRRVARAAAISPRAARRRAVIFHPMPPPPKNEGGTARAEHRRTLRRTGRPENVQKFEGTRGRVRSGGPPAEWGATAHRVSHQGCTVMGNINVLSPIKNDHGMQNTGLEMENIDKHDISPCLRAGRGSRMRRPLWDRRRDLQHPAAAGARDALAGRALRGPAAATGLREHGRTQCRLTVRELRT
eukprot:gene24769-biopygen22422